MSNADILRLRTQEELMDPRCPPEEEEALKRAMRAGADALDILAHAHVTTSCADCKYCGTLESWCIEEYVKTHYCGHPTPCKTEIRRDGSLPSDCPLRTRPSVVMLSEGVE